MIISKIKKGRKIYETINFVLNSVEETLKWQESAWDGKVIAHRMLSPKEIALVESGTNPAF